MRPVPSPSSSLRVFAAAALTIALSTSLDPRVRAVEQTTAAPQSRPSSALGTPEDIERLRRCYQALATKVVATPSQPSLSTLLPMVLTVPPSTNGSAASQNRAALVALMFYTNRWPLHAVVPEARGWPAIARRTPTLRARHDLAQHFIVSAAIAASAGMPLADLAGVFKELNDARGGSGFSFSDLAADRAGTLFGSLATRDEPSARRIQSRVSDAITEMDFMPDVAGLTDNMPDAEFMRRFGGIGAPGYNTVVIEIDRRIAALALYR